MIHLHKWVWRRRTMFDLHPNPVVEHGQLYQQCRTCGKRRPPR